MLRLAATLMFVGMAGFAGCRMGQAAGWTHAAAEPVEAVGRGMQAAAPAAGPWGVVVWGIGTGLAALGAAWGGRRYEQARHAAPPGTASVPVVSPPVVSPRDDVSP